MRRRTLLAVFAVGLASAWPALAQESGPVCADCHDVCAETIGHCLARGGRHTRPERIEAMLDCQQLCNLTRDTLLRGSPLQVDACALCAAACVRCAELCQELAREDPVMDRCAEAARRCAEACDSQLL